MKAKKKRKKEIHKLDILDRQRKKKNKEDYIYETHSDKR